MRNVDVVIIGAGPAGSVCGYLLKKSGIDCIIVDHATFPRDKICGGGLTAKAWNLLEHLMPGIKYDYHPVKHIRLQFEQDSVCEFEAELELRMTNRRDFDYALLKYYQHIGGEVMKGSFARFEQNSDKSIIVTLKSGNQFHCRYLVAADGANSLVRRQMLGEPKLQTLFMEQYVEQHEPDEIFVHFSRDYAPGCFYKFPGVGRDIYGFRSPETTRETFTKVLGDFGISLTRFRGAFIPLNTVHSTVENVILIGDAGGFPNKLTGEGLYDAFKTAYNAKCAIMENRPFEETNREVFEKMKKEEKVFKFFFSNAGFKLLRWGLGHSRIIKWLFDAKMKRETFIKG